MRLVSHVAAHLDRDPDDGHHARDHVGGIPLQTGALGPSEGRSRRQRNECPVPRRHGW